MNTHERTHSLYACLSVVFTLRSVGRLTEARSLLEQVIPLFRELKDRDALASAHQILGEVEAALGNYDQAQIEFQAVLHLAGETNDRYDEASGLRGLALVALAQGRHAEAEGHLEYSISILRQVTDWGFLAQALALLGNAARGRKQPTRARRLLLEALQLAAEAGELQTPVWALPTVALLLVDRGEPVRAVELQALVSSIPLAATSRVFEDVAGEELEAAAAQLPAHMVAAARERGRARDLMETAREVLAELEAGMGEAAPRRQ
jgi:tetratricopeptide (TPR) repeat protein